MTAINLGIGDWESAAENVPRLRLHNMYIIENPASPDKMSRVSRPSLGLFVDLPSGSQAIYGSWQQDGSLDGDALIVSGNDLYRVSTAGTAVFLGDIPGDEFCQFAGTSDRVIIVRNGIAYSTEGTTVTTVTMPDDLSVGSVACINAYFLLSVLDSDRFYYIEPGDTDPDALAFFTAERSPDPIVSIAIVSDEIWLLGSVGPEVWSATGDSTAPFQRISGRVYSDGCASRDTVVVASKGGFPALIWVTTNRGVVLAQGSPNRISNESVEELLRVGTNLRAWSFRMHRHDFYVLTADEFTLAYDVMTGLWGRWDTYLEDNFRGHLGFQFGSDVYAVDSTTGRIYILEDGYTDVDLPIVREISGQHPISGNSEPCGSIILRVNAGWSPSYDYEPFLELRWSDDQGATWSRYRQISMGTRGEYSKDVLLRSLGLMSRPGRNFEVRFSGPGRIRLDYMLLNEA